MSEIENAVNIQGNLAKDWGLSKGWAAPEDGVWSSSSPGFQGSHWTFTLLTIPGKSFSTVWPNMSEVGQNLGYMFGTIA